ncbi:MULTISPECIES: hypothetical protein [Methylobacterium]|jgi:hypothetical protein|uniref:hypothetical protein n=1 Tax=Methylobacterium TaxID=407 RepID=UPI000A737522|nr:MULTISPECIES: hypothetical protein [Methylobacterium]NGM37284.1 hypothetical protein [Methylobacterium sp. DB0501]UHC20362.1 hypothetical protein LRS73_34535 [Methylobacterium currus]
MKCGQQCEREIVETNQKREFNRWLASTTVALLLELGLLFAPQQAASQPAAPEHQKKSRSKFEYHDGRADERRPYRHPDLDIDPTNLKMEELRERLNALEERLERLEYLSNGSKKVH